MATINSSAIFPSIKFIATNGLGDIQELVGTIAVSSSFTHQGLTFSAVEAGEAGDLITIEIRESQSGSGVVGVEFSVTGTDVLISTENAFSTYNQTDVTTAFASAPSGVTDLISLSADGTTTLTSIVAQTALSGGEDATAGELEADSDYILLKRTDLHQLETSEQNDGRKLLWGITHKAEQIINALSDKPENFAITKSSASPVDSGSALRQVYTVAVKYAVENLDLKAEA